MILGIPTYTVVRVFAREFFYNFKAVQKITSGLSPESMNGSSAGQEKLDLLDIKAPRIIRRKKKQNESD